MQLQTIKPTQFALDFSAVEALLAHQPPAAIAPMAIALGKVSADATCAARIKKAAKLLAAGEALIAKAEELAAQPRQSNTSRRAQMASITGRRIEQDRVIGVTMVNLARAIESGKASMLSGITTRAAVETLDSELSSVIANAPDEVRQTMSEVEIVASCAKLRRPKWGASGACLERTLEVIAGLQGADEFQQLTAGKDHISLEALDLLKSMLPAKEYEYQLGWWNVEQHVRARRLLKAGIATDDDLRGALLEFIAYRESKREASALEKAMLTIIGTNRGIDFFPTPMALAIRMAAKARIHAGTDVLEPSAGTGHLADAAAQAGGLVDVLEIDEALSNILSLKGHNLMGKDFETLPVTKLYGAIIMNPPFGDRKDALHIMKAYEHLAPGGMLVAIAGEGVFGGRDAKAVCFQEWLLSMNAEVEKLPAGTFNDASLIVRTGANARLITLQRPM